MTELFLRLLNVSITAGWIVLAVVLLRPLLKKAPKWICCLLWGIVALRLVMPVSFESAVSLIPSPEVFPRDLADAQTPAIYSGIPAVNSAVNPLLTQYAADRTELDMLLTAAAAFWAGGVVALFLYSIFTWLRLYLQVRTNVCLRDNIYVCDYIGSPFIFGILRPKIYLPSGLKEDQLSYVLAHENAHLRRRDHWWKPLGFLLLTLYWFNPLLWVAYILLCQDIEQACDEKVIEKLDLSGRKAYSMALLDCSVRRRMIMACPVAFGEVSVKTRIKSVLGYKKPGFWILLASAAVCVAASFCFLTDPVPCAHEYSTVEIQAATCSQKGTQSHTCLHCSHSYTSYTEKLPHSYDGGVTAVHATCTETGTAVYTCTGCGREKKEALAMLSHISGELQTVQEPDCAHTGRMEGRCILCGLVCQEAVLPANDVHDLSERLVQEATCATPGEGVVECSRCDYSHSVEYAQLEHTYEDEIISTPTCADEGEKWLICTGCGDKQWRRIPATGEHRYVVTNWYFPRECFYCRQQEPTQDGNHHDLTESLSPKDAYHDVVDLPTIRWDPYP